MGFAKGWLQLPRRLVVLPGRGRMLHASRLVLVAWLLVIWPTLVGTQPRDRHSSPEKERLIAAAPKDDPEEDTLNLLRRLLNPEGLPEKVQRALELMMVKERFEEALALLSEAERELVALPEERARQISGRISFFRLVAYEALGEKEKVRAEHERLRLKHPEVARDVEELLAGPKPDPVYGSPYYVDTPKGPYRGKVIDAETKAPIQGAVVLAYWDYEEVTWFHTFARFYEAREVLTDNRGEFFMDVADIEGLAPPRTRIPEFIIFKPGYGYYPRHQVAPKTNLAEVFLGKGSVVQLKRWKTSQDRRKALLTPPVRVPEIKMRELLKALNEESRFLGLKGRYEIPGEKP